MMESLTTLLSDGVWSIMKAELLLNERHQLGPGSFVELRVWRMRQPVREAARALIYALAYVVDGVCVLRYDRETACAFGMPTALLADFWKDVDQWRPE